MIVSNVQRIRWMLLIALMLSAGFWLPAYGQTDVRDVQAFGAKGDGKTDDTAAVAAAVNALPAAGGVVHVPAGTYLVKGVVLRSGVNLRGVGRGTVLKAQPNAPAVVSFAAGEQRGISVSDLMIDGGYSEELIDSSIGIFLRTPAVVRDLTVQRVWFENHRGDAVSIAGGPGEEHSNLLLRDLDIRRTGLVQGCGIRMRSGRDIWIDRTVIFEVGSKPNDHQSSGIATMYRSNVTNLRITNCYIEGSAAHNIFLGDAHNVRVLNNRLSRSARDTGGNDSGIQANCAYAGRMRGLLISGNEIVDSGGYGLCTSGVDEVKIIGNHFLRGTDPVIRMQDNPKNWVIANNTFLDIGSVGPVVVADPEHSHNGVISGNVIRGCKMWGLAISGGQDVTITGNIITDNGQGWGRDEEGRIIHHNGDVLDLKESRAGLLLGGARHIVVTGNRIGNSAAGSTQAYGIVESSNSGKNMIFGNDLSGNTAGGFDAGGEGSVVRDNIGVEADPVQ